MDVFKFLENVKERKIKPKKSSFDTFIREENIKQGESRIPTYVIYYKYRSLWKPKYREYKMNYTHFFREFNKKFTSVRTGKRRYYLLDEKQFDMSKEGQARAEYYVKEKYKKINKKRKRKVSKSKKKV